MAVEDVARILVASVRDERLNNLTVPVLGPDELALAQVVDRVATEVGRKPRSVPAPVAIHRALAWVLERVMTIPLVSTAQVRILAEGVVQPVRAPDRLPDDLMPTTTFSPSSIRHGLPARRRFTLADLRVFRRTV